MSERRLLSQTIKNKTTNLIEIAITKMKVRTARTTPIQIQIQKTRVKNLSLL